MTKLDERAMVIYLSGKGTLADAYSQAKFELGEVGDARDWINKFFGGNNGELQS